MRGFLFLIAICGLMAAAPLPASAAQPRVAEERGAIVHYDAAGSRRVLTSGRYVQPELSPDGKTAVFIKEEVAGDPGFDTARSSVWLADVVSGKPRLLLASTPGGAATAKLAAMWKPQFSLNGGFVYVMAEAWVTSSAIHQINVTTGAHRYITDGALLFVIRQGRYAGYLMVQKHVYPKDTKGGATDPVFVIRPDGGESFMVPGSDKDDGEHSVEAWMRSQGRTRR
jgi:hypothetical protein